MIFCYKVVYLICFPVVVICIIVVTKITCMFWLSALFGSPCPSWNIAANVRGRCLGFTLAAAQLLTHCSNMRFTFALAVGVLTAVCLHIVCKKKRKKHPTII